MKKNKIEKICLALLALPLTRVKAYLNFVMSSCSLEAKSVVELSANRHFHYHYSNISKISKNLTKDEADYEKTCKILLSYFLSSCEIVPHTSVGLVNYYRFGQDICMVEKSHLPYLDGKVCGHKANSLGKNRDMEEDGSAKIFNRDMFLSVNGQAKDKITPQEAYAN